MRHRARGASWTPEQLLRARGYLYRVGTAGTLLLAGYGLIADSKLGLWLALLAAATGQGIAAVNTSTGKPA